MIVKRTQRNKYVIAMSIITFVQSALGEELTVEPIPPVVSEVMSEHSFQEMDPFLRALLIKLSKEGSDTPLCWSADTPIETVNAFESIQKQQLEKFRLNDGLQVGWNFTASGNRSTQGQPAIITYSFAPDNTQVPAGSVFTAGGSTLFTFFDALYGGASNRAEWQNAIHSAFTSWSDRTGIIFVHEQVDDGVSMRNSNNGGQLGIRGDIRIGARPSTDQRLSVLASADFPNIGDIVFNTRQGTSLNIAAKLQDVMAHEIGHAIGLQHVCPLNGTKLMEPIAQGILTPRTDDVLGAQRMYGDEFEMGSGNDGNPSFTDLGLVPVGSQRSIGNVSIDDNSDVDTFRFEIASLTQVSITVIPDGGDYPEAAQPTPDSNPTNCVQDSEKLNASAIMNLGFSLDGTETVNNQAAGGTESLDRAQLGSGEHFVRVFGDNTDNIQLYRLVVFVDRNRPDVFVNFAYAGPELGTLEQPFSSLIRAQSQVSAGTRLLIRSGSTLERPLLTKDLLLEATNGQVLIGTNP